MAGNLPSVPNLNPDSNLSRYLQDIRKFPLLEPEEEYMLAKRWKEHEDQEAAAKMALAALEARVRSEPSGRVALTVGAGIQACLAENEKWLHRLTDRHGPRFEIVTDGKYGDRNFDLAEQ